MTRLLLDLGFSRNHTIPGHYIFKTNWLFQKHSYEKMNELFISIRNCFLGKNTTPLARRILLEMIEGSVLRVMS